MPISVDRFDEEPAERLDIRAGTHQHRIRQFLAEDLSVSIAIPVDDSLLSPAARIRSYSGVCKSSLTRPHAVVRSDVQSVANATIVLPGVGFYHTVGYRHVTDFDTPGCRKSSRSCS